VITFELHLDMSAYAMSDGDNFLSNHYNCITSTSGILTGDTDTKTRSLIKQNNEYILYSV